MKVEINNPNNNRECKNQKCQYWMGNVKGNCYLFGEGCEQCIWFERERVDKEK